MRSAVHILFICALRTLTPMQAGDQGPSSFGPLPLSERNPLYQRHLRPKAESADLVAPGQWLVDLSLDYSNIFEYRFSEQYSENIDLEAFSQYIRVRRGFSERWELGLDGSLHSRSGGFLDRFIQDFHSAFGFPNDDRDLVANNGYSFTFGPSGGTPLLEFDKVQLGMGALESSLRYRVFGSDQASKALALQLLLKWPIGNRSVSNRKMEAAIAAAYSLRGRVWRLHSQAALSFLKQSEGFESIGHNQAWSYSLALERGFWRRYALIGQVDGGSLILDRTGLDSIDGPPLTGALGLMARWQRGWAARLAFVEDLSAVGPAVDFSLDLGVKHTF